VRLWRRRPREVDLYLPMMRIEHLFEAPRLDPFAPELAAYDPRPALERIVRAVQRAVQRADALSTGLQTVAWVILWFPINLLIYDRWYYRRDQRAYEKLRDLALTVRPQEGT